ncbi:hypothetical protein HDU96_004487 [Phlyctochytrium bullatum]|nr:hypothetical protein HDU96_004487 [Phlyctochytrium bullatum]
MLPWKRLLSVATHEHLVEYLVNNSIFRRMALRTHIEITKMSGQPVKHLEDTMTDLKNDVETKEGFVSLFFKELKEGFNKVFGLGNRR